MHRAYSFYMLVHDTFQLQKLNKWFNAWVCYTLKLYACSIRSTKYKPEGLKLQHTIASTPRCLLIAQCVCHHAYQNNRLIIISNLNSGSQLITIIVVIVCFLVSKQSGKYDFPVKTCDPCRVQMYLQHNIQLIHPLQLASYIATYMPWHEQYRTNGVMIS